MSDDTPCTKNKMSILECQELAKDEGFDNSTFYIVGPCGRVKAKWLDAYFGIYQIEGNDGFTMVDWRFFKDNGFHCEDFEVNNA